MLTLVQDFPRQFGRANCAKPSERSFEELRDLGGRAADSGNLSGALGYLDEALELARSASDQRLVDLAICNRSAVLISLGRNQEPKADLRQILVSGTFPENSFLAAYQLSRAHARDKAFKKGLFYAQVARDRALGLGSDKWMIHSYNQLANCLLDESRFEEAMQEYRRALRLESAEPSIMRAVLLVNLGYCWMMQGRLEEGLPLTFQALRWFRRFGTRAYEIWAHLDLCYAYLELDRCRRAREHGCRALALAQETGDAQCLKNALYLLGETERTDSNLESAYDYFSRLQQQFYPDNPQLVEWMLLVETRQLVNLRA
jgi:tetratricopeptide (TPR) repeat protein